MNAVPGVESASVDLAKARALVTVDPAQANRQALEQAIEGAGYSVPSGDGKANGQDRPSTPNGPVTIGSTPRPAAPPAPSTAVEEWNLSIGGMHCASCVARVEGALSAVPGVRDARVNLATERATVVVQPDRVNLDRLVESVGKAGYTARRSELSSAPRPRRPFAVSVTSRSPCGESGSRSASRWSFRSSCSGWARCSSPLSKTHPGSAGGCSPWRPFSRFTWGAVHPRGLAAIAPGLVEHGYLDRAGNLDGVPLQRRSFAHGVAASRLTSSWMPGSS